MSDTSKSLALGQEFVNPDEQALIQKIVQLSTARLEHMYPPNAILTRRDVHAKTHGCLRAEFIVSEDIRPELRRGVFKTPQTYKAWIRFSSGMPSIHSDTDPDVHGMAIKLMGVEGAKLLQGDDAEKRTQDFLMANSPTFFIRNLKEYVAFQEADFQNMNDGLLKQFALGIHFLFRGDMEELRKLVKALHQDVANPLQIRYWSQTPYQLGELAIKFSATPRLSQQSFKPEPPGDNYLQEAMARQLQSGEDVFFDFQVQVQTDAKAMPVEDACVAWDEELSPFQTVATIHIPKQTFGSPEQFRFAEQLSFTPWHSLPEHRPLGGINRARLAVYETISRLRHRQNGVSRQEPTGDEILS